MIVESVETRPVVIRLAKPIGSALGELREFGCILVSIRADGLVGQNLVFTLNNRRTDVLRAIIDEMADLVIGQDAGHIAGFWSRADTGTAVLLVEQLVEKAVAVSDRVYALAQGRIVMEASARESDLTLRLERAYFGDLHSGSTASENRCA